MKLINIGILAHVDAGKTTITEQLLFHTKSARQIGSVDSGTTQSDFLEVEKKRGISVYASLLPTTYNDTTINIVDTPGHVDFIAEVERSLLVLDAAVLVISAVEGIQAQTEILFDALQKTGTNSILFINKLDRAGSDSKKVIEDIKAKFGKRLLLCNKANGEGEKTIETVGRTLTDKDFYDDAAALASEFDEQILEAYLSDIQVPKDRLNKVLKEQITTGEILPVVLGSSLYGKGIDSLLNTIEAYITPTKNRQDEALSGIVYKVTHEQDVGRVAHVRLFGGVLKNRDIVLLNESEEPQKITQIRKYSGKKFTDTGKVEKGDIAALCGLKNCKVSDILGQLDKQYALQMAAPTLSVRVLHEKKEDRPALMRAFTELSAEDPKLDMAYRQDEHELNINITGTMQLEILEAVVKDRYNLNIHFSAPTVIYKETPAKKAIGYEAYTMPKPCWAIIKLEIEPGQRNSGLTYTANVPNNQLFYRYQNHIKAALPKALKQGLYNWEVIDLKVALIGGEHHTIHTHPMDFFLATPMAVMDGLQKAGTTLLEPMLQIRITAPEEFTGSLIGDILAMRGQFDSPFIKDGAVTMEARVPVATSLEYPIKLASMTGGRAFYFSKFDGYQPCEQALGQVAKRIGVNPLDRAKWILNQRNAIQESDRAFMG